MSIRSTHVALVATVVLACATASLSAQAADTVRVDYPATKCADCAAWNAPRAPFRVFGNTYYVGTAGLSSILITSPQGHVLIDGALPASAPHIEASIRALGFRVEDVKLILNSHAHFDHAGGIAALQRASGARVAATAWSAGVIEHGESNAQDPQFGILNPYPAAHDVQVIHDGETLRVGPIALTAHVTAGHTPGGTSWTWRSCDGARCLDFLYADSQTPVSADGFYFTRSSSYSTGEADFARGLDTLEHLKCDVLLTPHPGASALFQRIAARDAGSDSSLVDPGLCKRFVTAARKAVAERMTRERATPPSGGEAQVPRTSFISVDTNVKLEVLDWGGPGGPGRAVVLLAGNGQTAHSFDDFAPLLARFYHVYAITRRGFGASSRPTTGYGTDRRADDVLAVVDSLKLTRPVIAGHSLGGEELSSIGARHSDRVSGLIYLDPSSGAYDDGKTGDFIVDVAEVKNHLDALRAAGAAGKAAQMDSVLTTLRRIDLPALETALARMQDTLRFLPPVLSYPLMPPPTTGIAGAIDDGRQRYRDIQGPLLAIFQAPESPARLGTDSAITQRWLQQTPAFPGRFARGFPHATIVLIPNSTHYVFRSNPTEVLAAMRAFIATLP
jgi:metallo-beta-lactamase class B